MPARHRTEFTSVAGVAVRGGQNQHEAKLSYQGHVLMKNRHGLVVDACLTKPAGSPSARRRWRWRGTCRPAPRSGADKGYDTAGFVGGLRALGITPHLAQNTPHCRRAIDGRTTRHGGYAVSQRKRKLVEEIFGWAKTMTLLRKTRHRGVRRVG